MLRRILQNLLANAVQYTERGRILLAARRRGDHRSHRCLGHGPRHSQSQRAGQDLRGVPARRGGRALAAAAGSASGSRSSGAWRTRWGTRSSFARGPGQGTRFSVYRALCGADDAAFAAVRQECGRGAAGLRACRQRGRSSSTTMAAVLEAMRQLLDRWGCEARFAVGVSGVEALLDREPEFRPDIILADYHLDFGESGLRAVARLREALGKRDAGDRHHGGPCVATSPAKCRRPAARSCSSR